MYIYFLNVCDYPVCVFLLATVCAYWHYVDVMINGFSTTVLCFGFSSPNTLQLVTNFKLLLIYQIYGCMIDGNLYLFSNGVLVLASLI